MSAGPEAAMRGRGPSPNWSDEDLVKECLRGSQPAWSALVDKYKQLVYSVPIKYRMGADDAADVFQAVWMELYAQLPRLRSAGALRAWLLKVATHQCFHWRRRQQQEAARQAGDADPAEAPGEELLSPEWLEELEKAQILREAVAGLPPRCREMIQLLFYQQPPLPYADVARRLGLAVGSIGFIRGRCLKRLRKTLEGRGF